MFARLIVKYGVFSGNRGFNSESKSHVPFNFVFTVLNKIQSSFSLNFSIKYTMISMDKTIIVSEPKKRRVSLFRTCASPQQLLSQF